MSSTKSPSGRFGSFFGIKRRPSSNLVIRPSSPSYEQQQDPFCTNGPVVTAFSVSTGASPSSPLKDSLGRSEPALVIEIPKFVRRVHKDPPRRPGPHSPPAFQRQIDPDEHQLRVEGSDGDEAEDSTGSRSLGKRPPLTLRQGSATSVESLALAAAIAHANGMVLQPDPTSANSHRGKSPAIDEYPSPPPSAHGSPRSSRHSLEDDADELLHALGSVGSTGPSSLPTTPSFLDSFPSIPLSSLHLGRRDTRPPVPSVMLAAEALPVRPSSRPARQRAGSTPDAWSTPAPPVAQRHNSDRDQVWDVGGQGETSYNYPFSLGGLPLLGPPPSAPLPPEPVSPHFQPSVIHKHFHQLELDITSLTRVLTSTSSTPVGSTYPSTPDSSKILKKSASHSLLWREHSNMSASSAASSSQGILSSGSGSTFAIPLSSSPHKSDTAPPLYSTRHSSTQAIQTFSPVASNRQRSITDPLQVAPLKLKDKEKKPCSCKEHLRSRCSCRDSSRSKDEKDKDRESHPKRRFLSKYASLGSQVERETAALLASIVDQEDGHSTTSGHNGHDSKAFADEELSATIGLAISTPETPGESTANFTPISPASQRSPVDETVSRMSTSWTTNHNSVSPSEYKVQHILPPAELIRLERSGFATGDGVSSRGRELKLGSPAATSPLATSPLKSGIVDWSRRSTSTSRIDTAPVLPKARSQRSGSLAAASPISPSSNLPAAAIIPTPRHGLHGNSGAAKSANALPLGSESKAIRKRSSGPINLHQKLGMVRPMTTSSSPADGFAPLSLPPPPRSRARSIRSNNGESVDSTHHRWLSTASNTPSTSTIMQRHVSIMRKPSFIDMGDDDGRPSSEDANLAAAAPGTGIDDRWSYSNHGSRTPSVRSRSTTISGWQPSDIANITQTAPFVRGPSYSSRTDDSFLDMGKLSLDTIRSQDEEADPPVTSPTEQPPSRSQYKQLHRPSLGSPYGSIYY